VSQEQEWKARYVARMSALIGTENGCWEAADVAWDEADGEHSPEESAEEEVFEWRRSI
jgi:hypothetical protein